MCLLREILFTGINAFYTQASVGTLSRGLEPAGTCAASLRTPPSLEFGSRWLEIYKLGFHPIETSLMLGRSPVCERMSAQLLRRRET